MTDKVTFNLSRRAESALAEVRQETNVNTTDTINRSIVLHHVLRRYMTTDGMLTVIDPQSGEKINIYLL